MWNLSTLVFLCVSFYGVAYADDNCSSGNAITVESLSAGTSGAGGVNNSVVIALGDGLTKAGIQNFKGKRDDNDGGRGSGGGNGGNGNGNGGGDDNNHGGSSGLDCSNSSSDPETCYSVQSVPFCYNYVTGTFHGLRFSGNASNGNYTIVTGQTGNLYTGPYPSPTGNFTGPKGTPTGDHGGNGGGGNDDNKTATRTTLSSGGVATPVVTSGVSTPVSGVVTTSLGVFTTTLPATASADATGTQASASVSSVTPAGGAGQLALPHFGFLGAVLAMLLL